MSPADVRRHRQRGYNAAIKRKPYATTSELATDAEAQAYYHYSMGYFEGERDRKALDAALATKPKPKRSAK